MMSDPTHGSGRTKSYRIDYERALNAAQFEAVTYSDGPLLVIAGAGGLQPIPRLPPLARADRFVPRPASQVRKLRPGR